MNLPAHGWEIFYNDGKSISSKLAKWTDAPVDNVLAVLIWHDYHIPDVRKKTILTGRDYYFYDDPDSWGCTDNFDEVSSKSFKRGVWAEDELMEQISRTAFQKTNF